MNAHAEFKKRRKLICFRHRCRWLPRIKRHQLSKMVKVYDSLWKKGHLYQILMIWPISATRTSPLLPCHKLNNPTKIVFVSLEGNWKIIKNVSSPSHSASVFVLAFSHLKIPPEPNLFFSSCSRSWKFVLLAVKWCLHTVRYNKAASTHAALGTLFFFSWSCISNFAWTFEKLWLVTSFKVWRCGSRVLFRSIQSVGVMSSVVSHVSASLPRLLLQ